MDLTEEIFWICLFLFMGIGFILGGRHLEPAKNDFHLARYHAYIFGGGLLIVFVIKLINILTYLLA